ncbi:MAG: hypothetical protein ACTSX6_04800 [Candidatus Heimdallarchaeaceae archaeon]
MKKLPILIGLLFLFSILSAAAQGPPVPNPVKFTLEINGHKASYSDTLVKNTATGEVLTISDVPQLKIINGIGGFDLSNFKQGVTKAVPALGYLGDLIEVRVCDVHPDCTFSFYADYTNPSDFMFHTSIVTDQVYVCWDSTVVSDINNCPVQPTPDVEQKVETKVDTNDAETLASISAYYGQLIEAKIGNNKISKLIDDVVEFDGKEYDVKEEIYFTGSVKTSLDDEDYGTSPYLVLGTDAIKYKYIFTEQIDISKIDPEEQLEIDFLGKKLRIIDASANSITIRTGEEYYLKEGDVENINGKTVTIVTVGEDSVLVQVDDKSEIVSENSDKNINGLNVLVIDILYKSYEDSYVEFLIGTDSDEEVTDGSDFELFVSDDDTWEWNIALGGDNQYIGISNQEEYKFLDEDYKPLGVGESLMLPNDYVSVIFQEVTVSDNVELSFKVRDNYLYVRGNNEDSFVYGTDEYDELYVDVNGIYDNDKVLITNDKVRIGDSDIYLELGSVKIGKLEIKLDMSDILYDGVSFKDKDGSYLDYLGILFKDPENGVNDKTGFKVYVPEERPEVTIAIGEIINVAPPVIPDKTKPVDTPVPEKEIKEIEKIVEKKIPVKVVEYVCADGSKVENESECPEISIFDNLFLLATIVLSAFGFGAGLLALAKYWWNKGEKVRALKMMATAVKKGRAGAYDKYKKK